MVIIMWLVKSKPAISSNITMPITSFSHVLCHCKCVTTGVNQYVFAQMTSCTMRYDVIYHPIPISSQYLKMWRVDSPNLTLDATCAVTVFPCLFLFLRLKEPQINIGRIDLVWAMPSGESREMTWYQQYSIQSRNQTLLSVNREFKILRLWTTTTVKDATAHDPNHGHVTVHFSRVVLRLWWVVELFHLVGTTENILLAFCRLGNSRISSFRKKVFNSPALSERGAKYVSCV